MPIYRRRRRDPGIENQYPFVAIWAGTYDEERSTSERNKDVTRVED